MATRFYLPQSGTAPASPSYDSSWESVVNAVRTPLVTTPTNTAVTTRYTDKAAATEPYDSLAGQWVSEPLPAGAVAGTFTLTVGATESTGSRDAFLQCVVRVVSGDGSTVRGTLYSGQTATAESATTTAPNYEIALFSSKVRVLTVTMSSVAAQAGDRLVVEVGTRACNANTYNNSVQLNIGDGTSVSDLPATVDANGSTTDGRPWIEFSQDLFSAPSPGEVTLAGTLQSKTAAFTAATVLAASLTGTLQPKTASFAVDVPAAPDRTVSLAGQLQRKTSSFTVLAPADVTLDATLRPKTSAIAVLAGASVSLAAQLQPKTAAVALETAKTIALAGSLRRKTASITVASQPAIRLTATLRQKTAGFAAATLPTVVLAATLQPKLTTFMVRGVTPVTPVPEALRQLGPAPVVVARALGAVTVMAGPNGTQPVYSVSQASKQRARQQIVVDGVDISFLRGVRTPDVTYTLLSPLRYGPGQLDLPQVVACMEPLGEDDENRAADLSWMREGAPVEVHMVLDHPTEPPQVVVRDVYKGVLVAWDIDGPGLSIELGGEANGRAALRDRPDVLFPRVNDIGHQISDAVRDLGLPVYPALGAVTGIEVLTTGGVGHLEHIQSKVAEAWTRQGKYWSVMPNDAGAYMVQRKSDNVRHATVYFDDARTVPRLRRDLSEEPTRIFITGVTPQGQRVRFGVYPGLNQGPVPDFPGHMEEGDTGEGVRLLIGKLHAVGYLKLVEVAGGYDNDVAQAVKDLQDDAGLPKTGEVNLATWEALYDLNVTTTSLEGAHIEPAAQDTRVRRWNRSGSGTIMGFNDDYDPEVLPRDRTIDAGVGKTRSQLREFARTVLEAASTPNWVGDIVFHAGGLVRGEHALGSIITTADVMDARELIPTMNLWAPGFDGGTQFNIAALQVADDGTVTATVDTRFRDALEVWEIIDRNRESRNDPARRRQQRHRSSTIRKDSIGEWDEIGGELGHDVRLNAGWNVFEVVAAMEGTVAWLKIALEEPAEFACAVFGSKVDPGWLDDHVPAPLAAGGAKRWQTHRNALDDRWLLYSAGTPDEPCGYAPGRKGDDDPVTGRHVDDAGFRYASESRTLLYVAVWVREENTIPLGRIMRNQLEAGA